MHGIGRTSPLRRHRVSNRTRRSAILALVVAITLGLTATSAGAVGDWDPADVEGRYDFRWVGATYTRSDRVKLTVVFYPGFRVSALPHHGLLPGVMFSIDEFFQGWFTRNRRGGVKFGYADTASDCCTYYPVTEVDRLTLRVRFVPVDEGPPGLQIRGVSQWAGRHGPLDRTGWLRLEPLFHRGR